MINNFEAMLFDHKDDDFYLGEGYFPLEKTPEKFLFNFKYSCANLSGAAAASAQVRSVVVVASKWRRARNRGSVSRATRSSRSHGYGLTTGFTRVMTAG